MPATCVAFNCTSGYRAHETEPGVSFHKFPLRDPERLAKWVRNLRRENFVPKESHKICSKHFADSEFQSTRQDSNPTRRRSAEEQGGHLFLKRVLTDTAVPTIFNIPTYLLKKKTPEKRPTDEKVSSAARKLFDDRKQEHLNETFLDTDKINSLDDIEKQLECKSIPIPAGFSVVRTKDQLSLSVIDLRNENGPQITAALQVDTKLIYTLWHQGKKVEQASKRFGYFSEVTNTMSQILSWNLKPPNQDTLPQLSQIIQDLGYLVDSLDEDDEKGPRLKFLLEQLDLAACHRNTRKYSSELLALCTVLHASGPKGKLAGYEKLLSMSGVVASGSAASSFRSSSGKPRFGNASPSSTCTTKLEPIRLNQRWKIDNIATAIKLCQPASCLRSQVFRSPRFPEANWQLCLYPGGKREENKDNVSLFLKMSALPPGREICTRAEYRFYFLDDTDQPRFSNVNIGDFHAKPPKGGHSWGLRNIPRPKISNAVRADGSLVILCEIEMIGDVNRMKPEEEKSTALPSSSLVSLPNSFVQGQNLLFKEAFFSDYTVEVEGRAIPVHKSMLAAHSEVFRAMFSHENMTEVADKKIVIEDFKYDSVLPFLHYLYSGKVSESVVDEYAEHLLALSDKYGVPHLKAVSQDYLVTKVDSASVCQLLALADLYGADVLRSACISHVSSRKEEVVGNDSWKKLKDMNPTLVADVLENLVHRIDGPPPLKRSRLSF